MEVLNISNNNIRGSFGYEAPKYPEPDVVSVSIDWKSGGVDCSLTVDNCGNITAYSGDNFVEIDRARFLAFARIIEALPPT